jgi:hypothetical protein
LSGDSVAVPDPWAELARLDLVLLRQPIPQAGRYYRDERAIVLRSGLLLVQERAVLWHELVHAERGDARCDDPYFDSDQERSVEREAARRAMPFADLLEAGRGATSYAEVADSLKTTEALLHVRLHTLHPAERAALIRQNHQMEWAA